jgi:uncharacterized protein YjaZ
MQSNLVKINFYFPKASDKFKNKQELVNLIMESMHIDKTIQYAGYASEKDLKKDLLYHIGNIDIQKYRNISVNKKKIIEKTINKTIKKCNKILPLPTKNFIFVFPWFPSKEDLVFNGSFGFAAYSCVIHLFIELNVFNESSVANSVAHEINHTISYYYHFDRYGNWTLLDHMVNEGLAENFREDVLVNTDSAPWSIALTKKEAFDVLVSIKRYLNSKDQLLYQRILFGNDKYKRWTGYSIGYWLVKDFIDKNKSLSWEEIMKTNPEDILETVTKIGLNS